MPPPDGCKDYNPAVIGTCLSTVVAVAALPGDGRDPAALVGERDTGRILRVKRGAEAAGRGHRPGRRARPTAG